MSKFLNLGLLQYEVDSDCSVNIEKMNKHIKMLMSGMNRPEMIAGPEFALGLEARLTEEIMEFFSNIAKEHSIYFLPGTVIYKENDCLYNTLPIFGPDGRLIDKYHKICPFYPVENAFTQGDRFVVFDVPEKNLKVGVMICHDWCFPEVSRNLTLLGAELLVRPAADPEGLYEAYRYVAQVRALENQAYFISVNSCGNNPGYYSYGHSIIANPEGRAVYEAGDNEVNLCVTLDLELVRRTRKYGTSFSDQLLRQLKIFRFPAPYGDIANAPLFKNLPDPDLKMRERLELVQKEGLNFELGINKSKK
jgi:predicted amidohydrolase